MAKKIEKKIAVLGAGNMGTAIAKIISENGHFVNIWNWEGDHEPLKQIQLYHENKKYLPGIKLSDKVVSYFEIEETLVDADIIFFAIPSNVLEYTISFAARNIKNNSVLVDLSKGLEPHSLTLMTKVIAKHVRPKLKNNIVSLSGPSVATQMAKGNYTAMNIASKNRRAMKKVIDVLSNKFIKLIPTTDVIGVEVGGSFKNVYAIAMGMCDALGYSLNTKAALLTRAIDEIADLISAMGGRRKTAYELAGLGDLIGTALCPDSRNRIFGEYLGSGMSGKAALQRVKQVVEGVSATNCLIQLAQKYKVETPLAEMVYLAINSSKNPRKIMSDFLVRL